MLCALGLQAQSGLCRCGRGVIAPSLPRIARPRFLTLSDSSRLDWMIVKDTWRAFPGATAADLGDALRQGSPDLAARKGRHVDDYVERTVRNVLADPQVAEVRLRRGQEAPRRDESGHGEGGGRRGGSGGAAWAAGALDNVVRSLARDPNGVYGRGREGRDERDPGARDGTEDFDR